MCRRSSAAPVLARSAVGSATPRLWAPSVYPRARHLATRYLDASQPGASAPCGWRPTRVGTRRLHTKRFVGPARPAPDGSRSNASGPAASAPNGSRPSGSEPIASEPGASGTGVSGTGVSGAGDSPVVRSNRGALMWSGPGRAASTRSRQLGAVFRCWPEGAAARTSTGPPPRTTPPQRALRHRPARGGCPSGCGRVRRIISVAA